MVKTSSLLLQKKETRTQALGRFVFLVFLLHPSQQIRLYWCWVTSSELRHSAHKAIREEQADAFTLMHEYDHTDKLSMTSCAVSK